MLKKIVGIVILMFCAASLISAMVYAVGAKITVFAILVSLFFTLLLYIGLTLLSG